MWYSNRTNLQDGTINRHTSYDLASLTFSLPKVSVWMKTETPTPAVDQQNKKSYLVSIGTPAGRLHGAETWRRPVVTEYTDGTSHPGWPTFKMSSAKPGAVAEDVLEFVCNPTTPQIVETGLRKWRNWKSILRMSNDPAEQKEAREVLDKLAALWISSLTSTSPLSVTTFSAENIGGYGIR